jgi:undecaprenyl diphosphate synthase
MSVSDYHLSEKIDFSLPEHLAVIMDGNGRWAKQRRLPRIEGHRAGAKTVRMVVEESRRLGIKYLTLYTFSEENWQRPEGEVSGLMSLFVSHLKSELDLMLNNEVRLRAIGSLSHLPDKVQRVLNETIERTRNLTGMDLILAVSYSGREEIISACRKIGDLVAGKDLVPEEITGELFSNHLYAPDVPDPDLLIRTSGEFRISNFLLWQVAYSEVVISPVFWPDFSKEEYFRCLKEFSGRNRRYGLTGDQIGSSRKLEEK